ncbi:uncharacterized protein ASCRUDRAFT_120585 [Ascoidea rubescens DSM 1968]|uniref:Uncharacterized protein n=1 Tax=Ascoidea rubescens DSM 1968 TaxID=1344418 RepID=A0A1D2VAF5_9ASCO|nr:hypothetical protein ASCRUDRAFT_120585 [Ascoidea rubescens DSM 1968]ODV58403.1 hypothetical protein ASCRUDRAFT_120585 [Ascoidea rubescens DSM 1968]
MIETFLFIILMLFLFFISQESLLNRKFQERSSSIARGISDEYSIKISQFEQKCKIIENQINNKKRNLNEKNQLIIKLMTEINTKSIDSKNLKQNLNQKIAQLSEIKTSIALENDKAVKNDQIINDLKSKIDELKVEKYCLNEKFGKLYDKYHKYQVENQFLIEQNNLLDNEIFIKNLNLNNIGQNLKFFQDKNNSLNSKLSEILTIINEIKQKTSILDSIFQNFQNHWNIELNNLSDDINKNLPKILSKEQNTLNSQLDSLDINRNNPLTIDERFKQIIAIRSKYTEIHSKLKYEIHLRELKHYKIKESFEKDFKIKSSQINDLLDEIEFNDNQINQHIRELNIENIRFSTEFLKNNQLDFDANINNKLNSMINTLLSLRDRFSSTNPSISNTNTESLSFSKDHRPPMTLIPINGNTDSTLPTPINHNIHSTSSINNSNINKNSLSPIDRNRLGILKVKPLQGILKTPTLNDINSKKNKSKFSSRRFSGGSLFHRINSTSKDVRRSSYN